MTKAEFLAAATAAALASFRASGFPPGIAVAQAALESAWGNSELARRAHNYFGIKAHSRHDCIELPTVEMCAGRKVQVLARFVRYGSMQECFADRDRLIATAACYAEARSHVNDPEAFARALAAHWATDPKYAEKVLRLYREHALCTLDTGLQTASDNTEFNAASS